MGEDLSAYLDLSGTVHTNAGDYTDTWSFTGAPNYNDASGTVNDVIDKAVTSLLITTSPTIVQGPSADVVWSATLSGSNMGSITGQTVTFYLIDDLGNPILEIGSGLTDLSGNVSLTSVSYETGMYDIRAAFAGDANVKGSSDETSLLVADPGAAATGGGWYTLQGAGRVNFGFTVKLVEGTTDEYKGEVLLINKGSWRLKGTLDTYMSTGTSGAASGVGKLYLWNPDVDGLGNSGWELSVEEVPFTISFTDTYDGTGTGNAKKTVTLDTFGIHINYPVVSPEPGTLPNSAPQTLKGGNISIRTFKEADSNSTGSGKGKNK